MNRGFTLLEVLISIMILALGALAILPLFAVATQSHKRAMDQTHTGLIAPRIAAAIEENLIETGPAPIRGGRMIQYGQEYEYDADFTPLVRGAANDPLADAAFLLRVSVKWKEAGEERRETFDTVVLRRLPR